MRVAAGVLLSMLLTAASAPAFADLADKQSEATQRQEALRNRINDLQKEIDQRESDRKEAADSLKQSETAISQINRRLLELKQQDRLAQSDLNELNKQIATQQQTLKKRRTELADQLRSQYMSGLSPWAAMLSGDDPQALGRNLGYLGYIARARAATMEALHQDLLRLADLQNRADARTAEIAEVVSETQTQKTALGVQRKDRALVLARVEGQITAQRSEAARLGQDDERLSGVISGLDLAIAKQAEDARKAEEARKQAAELARKQAAAAARTAHQADVARQADEARRVAEATRRAQAARREAELTRREADQAAAAKSADASRRAAEARDAAAVRERADADLRRASEPPPAAAVASGPPPVVAAGRVIQSDARASIDNQVAAVTQPARAASSSSSASDSGNNDQVAGPSIGTGLRKGLTPPVAGQIQGRFGLGRPDGGVWRGIVLRAPEGTPVHVVATGTVVYAQWLRGFGNLLIVDNGDDYMTVYAYNQSILKHVGDNVHAGETVALVGATGGQVESGLYFEIRHHGAPVDPAQWLAQQ